MLSYTDIGLALNDLYSASIDATDNKNVDNDFLKDQLIKQLGPKAGEYFETGKVALGVANVAGATVKTFKEIGASLNFANAGVAKEFLGLFGSSLGLADDIAGKYNINKSSSNKKTK